MTFKSNLIPLKIPVNNPPVTQPFGVNPKYYRSYGISAHNGIDYAGSVNKYCYSAHRGKVTAVKFNRIYGNMVVLISFDGTFLTTYCHLKKFLVKVGQSIEAKCLIGEIGSTGNSTGRHLHFGLQLLPTTLNGYAGYIDPAPYFKTIETSIKPPVDNSMEARKARREATLRTLQAM